MTDHNNRHELIKEFSRLLSPFMSAVKKAGKEEDALLRPFEWLTDSASVIPLIESVIAPFDGKSPLRVLHVGSGSSVLGEHIIESQSLGHLVGQVVNVDKDVETLQKMEKRWNRREQLLPQQRKNKLEFLPVDFAGPEPIPYPAGHFQVVVDKSTLDCTLCSDSATAGLLSEVYRLLNPQGGTYVLISFHHTDLLRPLLENMPGADWQVSHTVMKRQVEDTIGTNNGKKDRCPDREPEKVVETSDGRGGAWSSGSFEPDEEYRRSVNIFICRRQGSGNDACLTEDQRMSSLIEHVHNTNDKWFQQDNPMLTLQRKETIQNLFDDNKPKAVSEKGVRLYDLQSAYQIIFTEAEREHLDYEYFLEDWQAWTATKNQKDPSIPNDKMSVDTALAFLEEMQ